MNKNISVTSLRKDLFNLLSEVIDKNEILSVFNKNLNKSVVIMSSDEYDAIEETLYLLSNPRNREKILKGIETPYEETEEFNWHVAESEE